ncbi:protein of unknown function [Candidatus Filomicrobium marinum]|uniref:Uncharacterized protein n=1 Tax=Candidatus Filomicrobium marinum TaxID=1608628 RepID=A0A0D6JDI0_9HYPH|nr:protein of unknown function [Candidatus Filomicrobium marinum]CPR17998.1 protein of unknown function [Candidatus Filomicrobium marinum]
MSSKGNACLPRIRALRQDAARQKHNLIRLLGIGKLALGINELSAVKISSSEATNDQKAIHRPQRMLRRCCDGRHSFSGRGRQRAHL